MGKFDAGSTVPAKPRPQAKNHSAGLEEAHLVVGLLGTAPTERLVKRAGSREIVDTKGDKADALFHVEIIAKPEDPGKHMFERDRTVRDDIAAATPGDHRLGASADAWRCRVRVVEWWSSRSARGRGRYGLRTHDGLTRSHPVQWGRRHKRPIQRLSWANARRQPS